MSRAPRIHIFEYLDVRKYLRDTYEARKAQGRGFSYRAFSRKAGLKSPNHLKRVIDGERDLTMDMAVVYAEALGLEGEEARYFQDLAAFSRAKTTPEKNDVYRRLSNTRGYQQVHRLDAAQAAYHANWYVPVVREMASLPGFQADPAWIAPRLQPSISRTEAEEALKILTSLGMLVSGRGGKLAPKDAVVSTGAETRGLHIVNFHRAMLQRAAASMDLLAAAERDISSLTFKTNEEGVAALKQRLQVFRQELVAFLSEKENQGDRVVQFNMQMFPLSKVITEPPK